MSRPIKFIQRIGLGEKAYWHHWGFLDKPKGFISPMANSPMAYSESFEFTGLLDKDGKEIYEGHILQPVGTRAKRDRIIMEWEQGADDIYSWTGYPFFQYDMDDMRIIGHIAEDGKDE